MHNLFCFLNPILRRKRKNISTDYGSFFESCYSYHFGSCVVLFSFFFNPLKEITLLITVVDIIRRLKFSSMEVCDKVIVIHYEFDLLPPK